MVTQLPSSRAKDQAGMLMTDLVVALVILLVAVAPLVYLYVQEHRMARALYHRAVITEVVDGEMEALMAGAWKAVPDGVSTYEVPKDISTTLPPGRFEVTRRPGRLRLEWIPENRWDGGGVVRIWGAE